MKVKHVVEFDPVRFSYCINNILERLEGLDVELQYNTAVNCNNVVIYSCLIIIRSPQIKCCDTCKFDGGHSNCGTCQDDLSNWEAK